MNDGGQAFPNTHTHPKGDFPGWHGKEGLTKREWYAGMALQGILASPHGRLELIDGHKPETSEDLARACFQMADIMIKEGEKN